MIVGICKVCVVEHSKELHSAVLRTHAALKERMMEVIGEREVVHKISKHKSSSPESRMGILPKAEKALRSKFGEVN